MVSLFIVLLLKANKYVRKITEVGLVDISLKQF